MVEADVIGRQRLRRSFRRVPALVLDVSRPATSRVWRTKRSGSVRFRKASLPVRRVALGQSRSRVPYHCEVADRWLLMSVL